MRAKRLNNVECLRVLIMFMIVIHHCVVSGLHLNSNLNSGIDCNNMMNYLLVFINSIVVVAVNVFFLISGYFTINFKLNKFLMLLGEVIFYSFFIYIIFAIEGGEILNVKNIMKYSILAVNEYWFMTVYLVLMLVAPYLNIVIDLLKADKRKYSIFIITLFAITCIYGFAFDKDVINVNGGYLLIYAIFLYFTGNFIKTYDIINDCKKMHILYMLAGGVNFLLALFLVYLGKGNMAWKLFSYNNPIVYIQAIALFISFLTIKCNGRIGIFIGRFGQYTLGIYLIHSHSLLIPYRFRELEIIMKDMGVIFWPFLILLYCIILYIVCNCVEILRKKIAKCFVKIRTINVKRV